MHPTTAARRTPASNTARGESDAKSDYVVPLTEREHAVFALIVDGYSYKQISSELFISHSTVSYHLSNIYPKAGVNSRHELTRWARRNPTSIRVA